MTVVLILLMFLAPIAGGILFGLLQLAYFTVLRRPADSYPSFPILFARGLLAFVIIAAALAMLVRCSPSSPASPS